MPGPVLLFRQHRGLSWAGTTQRAQEYPPQHRETVSMGVSPSPFSLPSHRGRISPSIQPGKSACGRNRFLGQLSEALQHAHPRGWALRKGKRLAGTKLGGAFAKEGRIIGSCVSFSCSPPLPRRLLKLLLHCGPVLSGRGKRRLGLEFMDARGKGGVTVFPRLCKTSHLAVLRTRVISGPCCFRLWQREVAGCSKRRSFLFQALCTLLNAGGGCVESSGCPGVLLMIYEG